jgi:hypothetical protein
MSDSGRPLKWQCLFCDGPADYDSDYCRKHRPIEDFEPEPIRKLKGTGKYTFAPPQEGQRQALLTCWVGATQLSQVEWVPAYIQPKAQVRVGQDDKVWIVEEIY